MHLHCHRTGRLACAFFAAALWCGSGAAAPYTPATDDELVETLRQRPLDAGERLSRELRAQARRQPGHLPVALQLARAAIERARRDGDPRELGQAQAALAPWWSVPDPPPAVRLLRATVLQSRHDFGAALADLDLLLAANGTPLELQAQAELTRAAVLQVQGRYALAAGGCERLLQPRYRALGAAAELPARVCLAELASLRGDTTSARSALQRLAAQAGAQQAGWLALVRAELAERLGDSREAQALYRQALARAGDDADVYTLAACADWLLDQGRAREAASLLEGREQADALLLRLAHAWKLLQDPRAPAASAALQRRFAATRQRGDTPHLREEAYAALRLQGNPALALQLALDNWAQQKEPADARLLAEAAFAAAQPAAAAPLQEFMRSTGYHDTRLARWLP
jgi:hypothetical protein